MQRKKTFGARELALVGILSALVFALTWIQIKIPIAYGQTARIHFGNIMCVLSGLLFGPLTGGLAAGFGSMLYDFTDPMYTPEFWITFLTKFAMGFVAGWLAHRAAKNLPAMPRYFLSALGGSLTYLVLYLMKTAIMQHFVYGLAWNAVWVVVGLKALASGFTAVFSTVACTMLAPVLRRALDSAGLFRTKKGHAG